MKWFTSDLHFSHPFVAEKRGFKSSKEHDDYIETMLNECLDQDDELFILGDLSRGTTQSITDALVRIKHLNVSRRHLHLILGNHDALSKSHARIVRFLEGFADVSLTGYTDVGGRNVMLNHFQFRHHFDELMRRNGGELSTNATAIAFRSYAPVDDGHSLLLHGHTHAKSMFEFDNSREMNIGVDAAMQMMRDGKRSSIAFSDYEIHWLFTKRLIERGDNE
jgi:calcineurin-like phosphoesterase family protein